MDPSLLLCPLIRGHISIKVGLRVGVRTRGCSGNTFTLDYIDQPDKFDEVVHAYGVNVYVESTGMSSFLSVYAWRGGECDGCC